MISRNLGEDLYAFLWASSSSSHSPIYHIFRPETSGLTFLQKAFGLKLALSSEEDFAFSGFLSSDFPLRFDLFVFLPPCFCFPPGPVSVSVQEALLHRRGSSGGAHGVSIKCLEAPATVMALGYHADGFFRLQIAPFS
jgi:hypothetical protein